VITINCGGKSIESAEPISVQNALNALIPDQTAHALGAFSAGRVYGLAEKLNTSCELRPITFSDEEGRRIYERSLRFILLLAVKRCFPGERLRIEHSIGYGIYFNLKDRRILQADAEMIEQTMREIVAEDLPFIRTRWSKEEAVRYFTSLGWTDKADLLRYRPYDYFTIYQCSDLCEYFYGAMLPSTGMVKAFQVRFHPPGMILQMPGRNDPAVPAPYISRPKQMATFYESNAWCKILNCRNAADLNDMITSGNIREFIRVNEALHDKSLAGIAEDILNMNARAVFLAGPSSSGKTTTANRLKVHLRVLGKNPKVISMDNFYLGRDKTPRDEEGKPDYESLYALDVPLFRQCIRDLLDGRETQIPLYDFNTGSRKEETLPMSLRNNDILIVEGIHGLNPELHKGFDRSEICKFYLSELTCLNLDDHNRIRTTDARLLRRTVRDHLFRGTSPENTLLMWNSVRNGEEKWIFPYQEQADVVFNTALHYELPIMRLYAYDALKQITPDSPVYYLAARLIKMLNYFLPCPKEALEEIPPLSILREFIGGNTFYD